MRFAVAQAAADIEPGAVGQHDVEHDQVELAGAELLLAFAPVGRHRDAKPLAVEIAAEQRPDLAVVVDDEDMGL